MMRCDAYERLLHAWMDDALAPGEAEEMRAHADGCPSCAELAAALREALALCHDMGGEAEVPHTAATAWRRAVRLEAAGTSARRKPFAMPRWEAWAGLAAGVLVLIGGANLVRLGRTNLLPNAALHDSAPAQIVLDMPASPADEAPEMALSDVHRALSLAPPAAALQEDADIPLEHEAAFEAFESEAFDLEALEFEASEPEALGSEAFDADGSMYAADGKSLAPLRAQALPAAESEAIDDVEARERAPVAPLAFLLDAIIFAALCLPIAAIAFCIVRLRKRGKKMQKPPES